MWRIKLWRPVLGATLCFALFGPAAAFSAPAVESADVSRFEGVVRIVNRQDDGASLGSGTLITGQSKVGMVLTCAHLFTDGVGELFVRAPGAKPMRAVLVGIDEENDLACLAVPGTHRTTVTVARRVPKVGSRLTSGGFGQEGYFRANRGEHLCFVTLEGGESRGVLEIAGSARQGDSGGPILNAAGELVGVIMGTDGMTVDGTHCGQIHRFLAQHPVTPALAAEVAQLASQPIRSRTVPFVATFDEGQIEDAAQPVTAAVVGRVSFDRRGVSGARVRLRGLADRVSEVDDQGRFAFEGLPAGHYQVEVEKVIKNRLRAARQSIVVSRAHAQHEVDLQLE